MRLKQINAVLALLSVLALLFHIGYCAFAYITMAYDPALKLLTVMPFFVLVCLHAVCGMCAVFLLGDGTRLDLYPGQNRQTVLQRISAALIFPLLFLHLNTFEILQSRAEAGGWFLFGLVLFAQTLFYGTVALHVSTSFSRALITLGILRNRKRKRTLDRVVYVLCAAAFLAAAIAVTRGELIMFLPKEG